MTKGLKRKFLTMVVDAIKVKPYFVAVEDQIPILPLPTGNQTPAAFVYWRASPLDYLTNSEKRAELNFSALGVVESNTHLELVKTDCSDELEEALENMLKDASFLALGVQVQVTQADPGSLSLVELGHQAGVFPPWGTVRVDGHIEYDYTART